jgi:hypothetical protein
VRENEQGGDAVDEVQGAVADGHKGCVVAQVQQVQGRRTVQTARWQVAQPVAAEVSAGRGGREEEEGEEKKGRRGEVWNTQVCQGGEAVEGARLDDADEVA